MRRDSGPGFVDPPPGVCMDVRAMADQTLDEAIGRSHRNDAIVPGTGGPAGNARLTAWTGLLLLALSVAELVTLLNVGRLISWHIVIGVLLVPPALLKTGSTGWRIIRYYAGNEPYRTAGPPPLVLRLLGPCVVVSTLAVLASGLVLIFIGVDASRRAVPGLAVSPLMIHKAVFVVWGVCTGLHTLGRLIPALRLTIGRRSGARTVPGAGSRGALMVGTMAIAAIVAAVILSVTHNGAWRTQPQHLDRQQRGQPTGTR